MHMIAASPLYRPQSSSNGFELPLCKKKPYAALARPYTQSLWAVSPDTSWQRSSFGPMLPMAGTRPTHARSQHARGKALLVQIYAVPCRGGVECGVVWGGVERVGVVHERAPARVIGCGCVCARDPTNLGSEGVARDPCGVFHVHSRRALAGILSVVVVLHVRTNLDRAFQIVFVDLVEAVAKPMQAARVEVGVPLQKSAACLGGAAKGGGDNGAVAMRCVADRVSG